MREEVSAAPAGTLHLLGAVPAICERTPPRGGVLDFSERSAKAELDLESIKLAS